MILKVTLRALTKKGWLMKVNYTRTINVGNY